jgi:hypothetical protein
MHAQAPRKIERCAELGRLWPSGGEPAFPREQQAKQARPKAQGSSRTFYSGFIFCDVVAVAGTRYRIKSRQMTVECLLLFGKD